MGVPAGIVLIFAALGWLAIRYNFWPPTCSILPIKEARQVCEFSKLDKAPAGKPAQLTFWTTASPTTPVGDKIFLAIDGREPVEMKRINDTSFETTVAAATGDNLSYGYYRNTNGSTSDKKQFKVKSFQKTIYDYIAGWSDLKMPGISKDLFPSVEMTDTWTINYNMQLFEDTRNNLDGSMARIAALGGQEIGIYSFIDMAGDKENFTLTETASPYYHWRDAAITESEMKTIVKKAKAHGLKTLIYYNIGADYNQYYDVSPLGRFTGGQAGSGSGGNAAEERAGADFGRDEPKTKAWLDRYFNQLKDVLAMWAKRADNAGIDAFDINPHYKPPSVEPLNDYADEKWKEIIAAVREVYRGKIYFDGNPQFRDLVDGLIYPLGRIKVRPNATVSEMRQAWAAILDRAESELASYKKPVFLKIGTQSYNDVTSGQPGWEFADFVEVEQKGYKRDWQEQADAYEAFFQALVGRTFFDGVASGMFAWDDLMGPEYTPVRYNDLSSNIRNKPAEAVWKKWVLSEE